MSTPTRPRPRTGPYRDNLCRTAPFQLTRAAEIVDRTDDGLTIDGYGAVFNSVTSISSWEGDFDEQIAPGAFKKSLREGTPKMQFDHGQHPLLGSLPLGTWDVCEEDETGVHVVGRLTDNWLIQPFRDAIAEGGVTGMSFRFSVVKENWTDVDGKRISPDDVGMLLWDPGDRGPLLRTLTELQVPEIGPVVWPAYEATDVGVRSIEGRRTVIIDVARLTQGHPGERAQLAKLIAIADRAAAERPTPQTPDVDSGAPPARSEPRSTDTPAERHSVAEPPTTETPAGEHSSTASTPLKPSDIAGMQSRLRLVTERVLALPPESSSEQEGGRNAQR